MTSPVVPAAYQALIDSPRVSAGTRHALQARAAADDPAYSPAALTPGQLDVLRAVMHRILPQPTTAEIDLAARLDAQLAEAQGDGWRFANLPDDRTAYARALATLEHHAIAQHQAGFATLPDTLQDAILAQAQSGELGGDALDAPQMQLWFQDLLGDAVKLYMAHPATLARIGYSGIAYGGDGPNKPGFTLLGLGEREPWEPVAHPPAPTP